MSFLRHLVRRVGAIPPEPLPDVTQIMRGDLPPIVREIASTDGRFVVLLSRDPEGIYRGHSFTWHTHADDDVWSANWTRRDFGTITKDSEVVLGEAQRRIDAYEQEHHVA